MNAILKPQQVVRCEATGQSCEVVSLLGSGGQGEVYRVRVGQSLLALKWYYPEWATAEQRAALEMLVRKGPPSDLFLWPVDLATAGGVPGFGYLMPLRQERYKSGIDLAKRRIEPSFRALATAGLNLAHGFLQLHAKGLAYRDISFGNLFLDPDTGDVQICDLDNVGIDGQPHNRVGGTMRFMAPEIVRGEAAPSTQTDQFSLAVLLHFMFFMAHPLEGRREAAIGCLDPAGQLRLYGTEPVYIADPNDKSNRPVPGQHDNVLAFWPLYPWFFKKLFTRAFTDGLRDPGNRVKESEWRAAMAQLRDSLIYCSTCGVECFLDLDTYRATKPATCWNRKCARALIAPPVQQLRKQFVTLNYDTRLYPHHMDEARRYDFSEAMAEVTKHPTNPNVWGLKNLSNVKWISTNAVNQVNEVETGRSVLIAPGTRLLFGKMEGEIKWIGQAEH
jgi:serine/threonine protein kinase